MPSSLCVVEVVEPGEGGVFRHVEGLINLLLSRGVVVHLAFSSRRRGVAMKMLVERVQAAGGEVIDLQVTNKPEFRDIKGLCRLVSLIRRVRPDVVHAHSSKAGALARFAALFVHRPRYLYTPHAYYGMAKFKTVSVGFFNWVERLIARVGSTITISPDEAEFARSVLWVPQKRIKTIHNPVDTVRFSPASPKQRRDARAALGVSDDTVVVGMVGRMCWQKDPETAYHAMGPVLQRHPKVKFVHLGWGEWKEYLLSLAEEYKVRDRVKILDYTEEPVSFYHGIDALLVTSRYEAGWPFVVLEALGCDLPIVAATCQGMSDIGAAGLSHLYPFQPEDHAGCTQAVEAWLETRSGSPKPCNHRRYAQTHFSTEACHGAVLDLYLQGRGEKRGVRSE